MKTVDSVRTHVKKNKNAYIAGGVCLVVGVAVGATVVLLKNTALVDVTQIRVWSPGDNNTFIIAAKGDPGNVIRCVEDGTIYASQGELARSIGAHKSTVSNYLHGRLDSLFGKHYEVVGKAGANLAS